MRWLHISDIHFNPGDYTVESVRKSLLRTIKGFERLDFVLFSGDLLYKHQRDTGGVQFLRDICNSTNVPLKNLFMCPGNHDVDREYEGRADRIKEARERGRLLSDPEYSELQGMGYKEYRRYYRELTGREYSDIGVHFDKNGSLPVRIIEANTNLTSSDEFDEGNITFMTPSLSRAGDEIKDDTKINILLIHHGIDQLREEEKVPFQHWLDNNYIDLVCCGHTHHASIQTYDETSIGIKQLTAGTVQNIRYAPPSFFMYDYDQSTCCVDIDVYTYNDDIESWQLNTGLSRAFPNGRRRIHLWRIYRKQYSEEAMQPISAIDVAQRYKYWINHLEKRFSREVGREVESVRTGQKEAFTAEKILQSLVRIGIPTWVAIDIVNRAIENIINSTPYSHQQLTTSNICEYVYQAICFTSVLPYTRVSEIKQWSNRYARRYWQNEVPFTLVNGTERVAVSVDYLKKSVFPKVFSELEDDGLRFEDIPTAESDAMTGEILDYIDGLEATDYDFDLFIKHIHEMITRPPHPWFCDHDHRVELIQYNYNHLGNHLTKLERNHDNYIVYQELLYHAGSIFMLAGGIITGCKEESPLYFFRLGVRSLTKAKRKRGEEYFANTISKAKSTIEGAGFDWDGLLKLVDNLNTLQGVEIRPMVVNSHSYVLKLCNMAMRVAEVLIANPLYLE